MVAYLTRMPAGIAGDVNRAWASIIEPGSITPVGTTGAPAAYGVPLVVDQTAGNVGNVRGIVTAYSDVAASLYGILIRSYPTNSSQDPLFTSTPPASGICDVLRAGYVSVLLSGSTPAIKGAPVYIWSAAPSGTHITGGWEATNPSGNGFVVPYAYFMGPADSSGNTEISFDLL